ncbi:MAG: DUF479 domain-containing protein, partial [Rhodocyclaceae bacterium]|nr:DUF479 domain-containing protein [Rhodocyclaceae bacterium]
MNFLAHAFLAGADPGLRIGGLIGDFVKGPLPAGLPTDLAEGVRLHRRIDVWAETHPAFRRSRGRVATDRRRFAGILVDMYYDHFLADQWERRHHLPLAQFTAETYALAGARAAELPAGFVRLLPRMRAMDWLASYRRIAAVEEALDRMATRLSRPDGLRGGIADLARDYAGFEADFAEFIGDATRMTAEAVAAAGLPDPGRPPGV